jgi:hypothetical protein
MVYRFGDYEPERYELRRAGRRVALEPRVVEVLAGHAQWLATDPDFDRLRRHPRFTALVARASRRARAPVSA